MVVSIQVCPGILPEVWSAGIQKFLTQPLFVAANFTNIPGKYVKREKCVADFEKIISGACDEMPEQAFYMVGTLEEAHEKAKLLY